MVDVLWMRDSHSHRRIAESFRRDPQGSAPRAPRLLVSVRDAVEAAAALHGGADIIDVKEPSRGTLGMADSAVIGELIAAVAGRVLVSAALGEVSEWLYASAGGSPCSTPAAPSDNVIHRGATGFASALPMLPAGLSFAKLGLAGMGRHSCWAAEWRRIRSAFEHAAGSPLNWVAVGYADADAAAAPPMDDIIAAAARTGCVGVLIDTFDKSSGSLPQLRTAWEVHRWQSQAREHGLFFAVAGKLRAEDLQRECIRCADVVGVRSAACAGGDRTERITADRVAALCRSLQRGQARLEHAAG